VGRAYSTYEERKGEMQTLFWRGNLRERDYLADPGLDGRIILRWNFIKWDGENGLDVSGFG
jgi:hypothetical protein